MGKKLSRLRRMRISLYRNFELKKPTFTRVLTFPAKLSLNAESLFGERLRYLYLFR